MFVTLPFIHVRLKHPLGLPVSGYRLDRRVYANLEACEKSRAERGRLGDFGADNRNLRNVGLKLHEQFVVNHMA